jgi:hypothetical protein
LGAETRRARGHVGHVKDVQASGGDHSDRQIPAVGGGIGGWGPASTGCPRRDLTAATVERIIHEGPGGRHVFKIIH